MPAKKKPTTKKNSKAKPEAGKQTIDVTNKKPASPSTGSRPVIIGHRNKIQDSMVKSKSTPVAKKEPEGTTNTLGITPEEVKEAPTVPAVDESTEEDQPEEKIIKIPESKGDKPELPKEMQLDEEGDGKQTDTKESNKEQVEPEEEAPKVPSVVTEETSEEKEAEPESEPGESTEEVEEKQEEPTEDSADGLAAEEEPTEAENDQTEESDSTKEDTDEEASADEADDEVQVGQEDETKTDDQEVEVGSGEEGPSEEAGSSVQEPEGGLVDELAKQAADKKQQKEQDKQASVREEKVTALINSKQYYVPITQVTKRRIKHVVIALLLLAVLLLGLNLAVDAELLDVGVQPLTNIL